MLCMLPSPPHLWSVAEAGEACGAEEAEQVWLVVGTLARREAAAAARLVALARRQDLVTVGVVPGRAMQYSGVQVCSVLVLCDVQCSAVAYRCLCCLMMCIVWAVGLHSTRAHEQHRRVPASTPVTATRVLCNARHVGNAAAPGALVLVAQHLVRVLNLLESSVSLLQAVLVLVCASRARGHAGSGRQKSAQLLLLLLPILVLLLMLQLCWPVCSAGTAGCAASSACGGGAEPGGRPGRTWVPDQRHLAVRLLDHVIVRAALHPQHLVEAAHLVRHPAGCCRCTGLRRTRW